MKAAQINEYGGPDKVVVQEIETPTPGERQILVKVHASSLNPFDTMVRSGMLQDAIPLTLPVTLGGDIAGEIEKLGTGVDGFAVGDKIYGQANTVARNSGAFAEYAATDAGQIAKMPNDLSFTDTASLPLVGVSALQALAEHMSLQAGQKILIHGGSGGIGSVAIQIAKHLGTHVTTTVPADAIAFAKELGADVVIDYQSQDFSEIIKDADAVFDTVGGETYEKSFAVLKPNGILVSMIAPVDETRAAEYGVQAIYQSTHVNTDRLNKLTELINQKVITPHVAEVFPLEQIQEAFKARESGNTHGKVVIAVS